MPRHIGRPFRQRGHALVAIGTNPWGRAPVRPDSRGLQAIRAQQSRYQQRASRPPAPPAGWTRYSLTRLLLAPSSRHLVPSSALQAQRQTQGDAAAR